MPSSTRALPGYVQSNGETTAMIRPNPTSGFFELVVTFLEEICLH